MSKIDNIEDTRRQVESWEFDSAFQILEDAALVDRPELLTPTVEHDDEHDVLVDSNDWTPLTGFTGQHAYEGAVMHPSEQLSGDLLEHVVTTPGVYVISVVEVFDCDGLCEPGDCDRDGTCDHDPAGWAVLRLDEGVTR